MVGLCPILRTRLHTLKETLDITVARWVRVEPYTGGRQVKVVGTLWSQKGGCSLQPPFFTLRAGTIGKGQGITAHDFSFRLIRYVHTVDCLERVLDAVLGAIGIVSAKHKVVANALVG